LELLVRKKRTKMSLQVRGGGEILAKQRVFMEKELTLKRIQLLKKDYSRGFIPDVGYER